MVLDARLEVYAQLNGVDVRVINGSTSDSFLEGSGWVMTSGQLVVQGVHTAPIGALCRLSYRSARYAGAMPRARLRVLRCSPDPMRRTTSVELGCLLSLYMDKAQAPPPIDVDIDTDSPDRYRVDTADNFVREGLSGAGIPYSGVPSMGARILKDWRWSDGYLRKVGEILGAMNCFGYMGPDEVLRFGSLSSPSAAGPSLTLDDLIDMSPLTGGTRPGAVIYGRGRYYGSPVKSPAQVFAEDLARRREEEQREADEPMPELPPSQSGTDWTREMTSTSLFVPKTTTGSGNVSREEQGFSKESYNESVYDRQGKLLRSTEETIEHSYNLNSAHPEECVSYAARVDAKSERAKANGDFALSRVSYTTFVGSRVETTYEYEAVDLPYILDRPDEARMMQYDFGSTGDEGFSRDYMTALVDYESKLAAARVIRQSVSRYLPSAAVRGSTGLKFLYQEEDGSITDIGPGGGGLLLVESIDTYTTYESATRTLIKTIRTLYGPASQQGAAGTAASKLEKSSEALEYLRTIMDSSRTEVTHTIQVKRPDRSNPGGSSDAAASDPATESPSPYQPSTADTYIEVAVNSGGTVAGTYQFYDCPLTFAKIISSEAQTILDLGSVRFVDLIPVAAGSRESREYANGFIREYAITQNRLSLAFRHGHQVTTTMDKLPITPGALFHVNAPGGMGSYRVNGLNVVFDNRQCLVSVDALYWGATG